MTTIRTLIARALRAIGLSRAAAAVEPSATSVTLGSGGTGPYRPPTSGEDGQ